MNMTLEQKEQYKYYLDNINTYSVEKIINLIETDLKIAYLKGYKDAVDETQNEVHEKD